MAKTLTKSMTSGSPMKLILNFSSAMLLGLLFQQLYNLIDTAIVGKILGKTALAGVGSTGSINFLIIGLCTGICNGFAIPVAQKFGSGQHGAMRTFIFNAAFLSVILSAAITASVAVLCRPILTVMQTPDSIFDYAYIYIFVIFLGIPFTFLYNLTAGILRSLGDSKSPVIFLGISSVINIALDVIFMLPLKMSVFGAALATVLAQAVSGVACLIYIKKKFPVLKMSREERKISLSSCRYLLYIGLPMGIQYSITAIGTIIIQRSVNTFNDENIIAGVTAATKIMNLFFITFDALGATMATYAGQNTGAQEYDRLNKGVYAASALGFIYSAISFLALFFAGEKLTLLFTEESESEILAYAHKFLLFAAAGQPLVALVNIVRFTIQGMGFSLVAVSAGIFETLARAFAGFVLVSATGFTGICLAHPLAWLAADIFLIPAFYKCKNKLKKQSLKKIPT